MVRKGFRHRKDVIGTTMLIGLIALIVVVGLVFTSATKDSTLIKKVAFYWVVMALFLSLLGTHLFRGEVLIPRSRMMLPLGVFLSLAAVSTLLSSYRYASIQELIGLVCCGMLVFVTVRSVTNRRAFLLVAGILAAVAALSCLYGILQHYGLDPFFGDEASLLGEERSFSTMGHPNFFGSFLILGLPVLLSLFYWSEKGLVKSLVMILVCALLLCLFYTQSRGAWLGLLGALPVWFFLSLASRRWRLILLGPAVAAVAAMLLLLFSERARGYVILWALPFWLLAILVLQLSRRERRVHFPRKPVWGALLVAAVVSVSILLVDHEQVGKRMQAVFETEKGSVETRRILWAGTLKMFASRPILGWGTGTFSIYFPRFRDPATAGKIMPNTLHAHSEYLEVAAETGVIGLGVFLWMLLAFVGESVRGIGRAKESLQKVAVIGLLAGCTAILLQGAVSVTTRWAVGRFFLWLGIGLTIAVGRIRAPAEKAGKRGKKEQFAAEEGDRFRRVRIGAIRGPGAQAIFILLAVALAAAAAWWGGRVFKSAVSTREGEGYQIAGEKIGSSADEAGLPEALDKKGILWERAIELYRRAIKLNPYNLSAYYKLGHCYNLQGRFMDSLRTYQQMAKLAPDSSDIHFNLGVVYANMGRWEDSRTEYEKALSMKVGPLSRLGFARAHENLGALDKAEEHYKIASEAYPAYRVRALNGLAGLYLRRGRNSKAMELYREALKIDPQDADAHLGAGLIYQAAGDDERSKGGGERAQEYYRRSVAELEAAVEKRPGNVPTRAALGLVYAQVERFDDALAQLNIAIGIRPNSPLVHLNLGRVYLAKQERAKAEEEFRQTMKLHPAGPWAAEAKKHLNKMRVE